MEEIGICIEDSPMATIATNLRGVLDNTGATLVVPSTDVREDEDVQMMGCCVRWFLCVWIRRIR